MQRSELRGHRFDQTGIRDFDRGGRRRRDCGDGPPTARLGESGSEFHQAPSAGQGAKFSSTHAGIGRGAVLVVNRASVFDYAVAF